MINLGLHLWQDNTGLISAQNQYIFKFVAHFSMHFFIPHAIKNSLYVKPTSHKPPSNKDLCDSISTKWNLAQMLSSISLNPLNKEMIP